VKEDSFGVAFLAVDGTGTYIDVFYDAVEKLRHESNTSPGRLLGHVMAHEIGHLLIGSHAHSSWGIMRPVWSRRELRSTEMGSVFFTVDQARTMKTRLLSAAVAMADQENTWDIPSGSWQVAREPQTQTVSNDATYTVQGATPEREAMLRRQIQLMQPAVLPYRIHFVPHWQYVYAAKIYQLHVPTGMGSIMFTHLPSRSVFIDEDRYLGEEWLGHWIAHELGHLATNSVREEDAERIAREYRIRLRAAPKKSRSSGIANQLSSEETVLGSH
jgi:hypothetical protein